MINKLTHLKPVSLARGFSSSRYHPFKELKKRQLLYYTSNNSLVQEQDLDTMFHKDPGVYIGFDPTADSIHLGNFLGLVALTHFRLAGFQPIVLFGGATGLIGDPSGRVKERDVMAEQTVNDNVQKFRRQFDVLNSNVEKRIGKEGLKDIVYVNNIDFYKEMNVITFLRDVGKHCRLSSMLSKDSVKTRMVEASDESPHEGMSFTEFSYQIFQGYDFLRLYQDYGCQIQIGGSDQWGNISSGIDLVRRIKGDSSEKLSDKASTVYGATYSLLTDSKGNKIGKSTGDGALWMDPAKTSPYQLYQFMLNVEDAECK